MTATPTSRLTAPGRVLVTLASTVTGLTMLLSFKTHSSIATSAAAVAVAAATSTPSASSTPLASSTPSIPAQATSSPAPAATKTVTKAVTATATKAATKAALTPTATKAAATAAAPTTTTVTGSAVDTKWGPVQVKITVTGGKITSAVAVEYPSSNGRDQQINAYAIPTLEQETVSAGSASIDMVSGATYTSNGYIASLQSALAKV